MLEFEVSPRLSFLTYSIVMQSNTRMFIVLTQASSGSDKSKLLIQLHRLPFASLNLFAIFIYVATDMMVFDHVRGEFEVQ